MRDLWIAPPGDDGSVRKAQRKKLRRGAMAYLVGLSLFAGTITWVAMNKSTPVSTSDVLAEFRADTGQSDSDSETTTEGKRGKVERNASSGKTKRVQKTSDYEGSAAEAAGSSEASVEQPADTQASDQSTSSDQSPSTAAAQPEQEKDTRSLPLEGVYEWEVDGVERAPGVDRRLPRRSHRVITHDDERSWTEHHIFSEEKETWFELFIAKDGVAARSSRNWVRMGPVTVDRTVRFDPPMLVSNFPFHMGATWKGSFSGKTSGSYEGRTFEHTWIEIGGEKVEVWGAEVAMSMKGEVEGRVVTRTWVSPKYNLAVKQYQMSDVKSGPGSYYSEWTGQTLSVRPQT